MNEHTKGPWHVHVPVETECQNGSGHYVQAADGEGVAYAQRGIADATLIAAAPTMLSALIELVACEGGAWRVERYAMERKEALDKARAAITKATHVSASAAEQGRSA